MTHTKFFCENPECQAPYTEYVNGCPRCGARGLKFSVRECPVVPLRIPVHGYDNYADKRKAALRQHGEVTWEENPEYVGPTKLTDKKGFQEIRGWLVVDVKEESI